MTVIAAPQPTTSSRGETRVVLEPVSWSLYEQILRELGDSRGTRLAYNNGRLEITSPSDSHEDVKSVVRRLIEMYAEARELDIHCYGSFTMRRKDVGAGIEADECYYVQSFPLIEGKQGLDLSVDPPPDLAIEVDISPPALAKQPIYAALGVPEVWRYDGKRFHVMPRTESGTYDEVPRSAAFPDLPIEELNRFVQIGLKSRQPAAIRALRQWLRDREQGT